MAEKRALRMHPRLLWDVITKQAGTLQKAILEGVMNSVDAGATRCDVTIDKGTFTISDDGKGFSSRREIEDFFETFGYPHEEGDAHYGRFRMGRGQMFAFGANVWNTNGFRMEVDLKPQEKTASDGLGYDFSEIDPVPGCSIGVNLYRKLVTSEVDEVEREIAKYVAYSPIPVTVNGKVVSKDPTKEKWDVVTDDAYIRYRERGNLSIYNLGVLVHDESSYKYGTGGVVVSRAKLDVNFARNAVMDTCPVWRRTVRRIREDSGTAIKKKSANKITEAERQASIENLLTNRVPVKDVENLPLFETVNGNRISLVALGERLQKPEGHRLGVAPLKDRVATRVLESKLAIVFSQAMLDITDCETGLELVGKLFRAATRDGSYRAAYRFDPKGRKEITRSEMLAIVPDDMTEVAQSKLKPGEKLALSILQAANDKVSQVFLNVSALKDPGQGYGDWRLRSLVNVGVRGSLMDRLTARVPAGAQNRVVRIGESSVAQAWTDGQGVIWFERGMLKHVQSTTGMIRLANIMVHEWLHDTPDTDTHVHDVEFYETYHDLTVNTDLVGTCLTNMLECYNRAVKKDERKPSAALSKLTDRQDLLGDRPPAVAEAPAPEQEHEPVPAGMAASARP